MNPALQEMIEKVDFSYNRRLKKQNEIWEGFDEEITKLTGIVSQEFNRVLGEIQLSNKIDNNERKVKINDFDVKYEAQFKRFDIEIKDWSVDINGKPHSDKEGYYAYCAYSYLEPVTGFGNELNPKIAEFLKDFNVSYIHYDCHCGSDHA